MTKWKIRIVTEKKAIFKRLLMWLHLEFLCKLELLIFNLLSIQVIKKLMRTAPSLYLIRSLVCRSKHITQWGQIYEVELQGPHFYLKHIKISNQRNNTTLCDDLPETRTGYGRIDKEWNSLVQIITSDDLCELNLECEVKGREACWSELKSAF